MRRPAQLSRRERTEARTGLEVSGQIQELVKNGMWEGKREAYPEQSLTSGLATGVAGRREGLCAQMGKLRAGGGEGLDFKPWV